MAWVDVGGLTAGTVMPSDTDSYLPVRALPQQKVRWGFSKVLPSSVETNYGTVVGAGAGQTIAQSGGALVITSGTTARSELIFRSATTWKDCLSFRWSTVLSQRIVNQNYIIEFVDVIGDNLAYTITSATSITVTIPSNPFTSQNVGQTVTIGNFAGTGTFLSGSAVIASVSGNDVVFTVAGFAAGTGTCSIFGWNYHRFTYNGTTATNVAYQTQRNGWPGTSVTATINTTASPGHIGIYNVEDNIAAFLDQLRVSATGLPTTMRASAVQDMPDDTLPMYLQIRSLNGSTAPASTTTWTITFIDIESYVPQQASITSARAQSVNATIPVQVLSAPTTAVSGSLTSAGTTTNTPATPTNYNVVTAASTNAAFIKASAGTLYELTISNVTATASYIKIYNKASAPTVGTDVPVLTIPAPANSTVSMEFGALGKRLGTGIAIAATAAIAATDTAVTVAGIQINASYI